MIFSGPRKWVRDFWGPELSLLTDSSPFLYPFLGWPCLHSDSQPSGGDAEGAHHEDIHHVIPGKISNRDSSVSGAGPQAWRREDFCVVLLEKPPSTVQYFIFNSFFLKSYSFGLSKEISTLMSEPWRETLTLCIQIEHFYTLRTGQPRSFRKLTPLLDGTSWYLCFLFQLTQSYFFRANWN